MRISIHAPRTGSDALFQVFCIPTEDFNPRSPHGERLGAGLWGQTPEDFNPRSPHGERHKRRILPCPVQRISIHAPRTGSDTPRIRRSFCTKSFQSTLPARGATALSETGRYQAGDFNPRSPHGERPVLPLCAVTRPTHFNPRSPHGERHRERKNCKSGIAFQSTLPARGATPLESRHSDQRHISIHAPRTGSDDRSR